MYIFFKIGAFILLAVIHESNTAASKFVVSNEKVTFHEGFVRCKQNNMDPVEILSEEDERELEAVLPDIEAGWQFGYWIFATSLVNNQTFYWLNSGRPLLYTKFNVNEPNNVLGGENCLEILNVGTTKNFKWNDVPCHNKIKFICQSRSRQSPNSGDFGDLAQG